MNVHLPAAMTTPAFLAWAEAQEERYELVEGRVVMMAGGTRAHWQIALNVAKTLDASIDHTRWEVVPEFGVELGPSTVRFSDVVVDVTGGAPSDKMARAPVLIVEVLSPSSARTDLGDKAAEYLKLESLATYIVVAQDEIKAWVWTRSDNGFPSGPAVLEGPEAVIAIPALAIGLPLQEIFGRLRLA